MLGVGDPSQLVPPPWSSIAQRVNLPGDLHEFLQKQGPMPVAPDSRRGYHRMYMRAEGVLYYHQSFYAIYVADVSRSGAGFYSPVQLLPSAPARIWMPDGRQLSLTTKICVRIQEACYRCGALFADE